MTVRYFRNEIYNIILKALGKWCEENCEGDRDTCISALSGSRILVNENQVDRIKEDADGAEFVVDIRPFDSGKDFRENVDENDLGLDARYKTLEFSD